MSETSATQTMRTNLKRLAPSPQHVKLTRFEDAMSPGIPDMLVQARLRPKNPSSLGRACAFWLEGKYVREHPKRDSTRVKPGLRTEQSLWMSDALPAGAVCFVWVRDRDLGWCAWHITSDDVLDMLTEGIPLAQWRAINWHSTCKSLVADIYARVGLARR